MANTIFMLVNLSYLQPEPLKRCDNPLSEVSMLCIDSGGGHVCIDSGGGYFENLLRIVIA